MNSHSGTSSSRHQRHNERSMLEANDSFDFVLIEADEGTCLGGQMMNNGNDDDDSYDYCEDACSMPSNGEESSDNFVDMKDSVLSVPDILMKDLDEAHAAAKLVQFDDDVVLQDSDIRSASSVSPRKSDHFSTASSVVSMEDDDDFSSPKKVIQESSSISLDKNYRGMEEEMECPSDEPANIRTIPVASSLPNKQRDIQHTNGIQSSQSSMSSFATGTTGSVSRTSNKKRRKKLKMLKKAQAAANAAMQLAEKKVEDSAASTSKLSASSKKPKPLLNQNIEKNKIRSSKKVTNIAVACATETMAAYRQELMLRGVK